MGGWYQLKAAAALKELNVQQNRGLTEQDVQQRRAKYGLNQLAQAKKISPWALFFSQFKDVLVIVLLVAAAVSFGVSFLEEEGTITESVLIFAIVIAIAVIGFFNEYKAEKTVEALKKLVGHVTLVRRGSKVIEIKASELVPGDIVLLSEGQKIPADIRLLSVKSLQVDEASLTGESIPVSKANKALSKSAALGDQKNMVFSGTVVTAGTAEGLVVETGSNTEIGKIAHMVTEVEDELTPMQKKLDALGKKLGVLVLLISILVFIIIFFNVGDTTDETLLHRLIFAFTVAIALAVAAIPEGLSFVVRISLALGARRMASKNALVRKLSAVEALGSTDVIASDKTGTLTKGQMTVRSIMSDGDVFSVEGNGYEFSGKFKKAGKQLKKLNQLEKTLLIGLLCNNSRVNDGQAIGDPTEAALIVSAEKAGYQREKTNRQLKRVDEFPFTSDRKRMTTVHKRSKDFLVCSKGAPDILLAHCNRLLINGKVVKMTAKHKKMIIDANHSMATRALRVLGFAYKEVKAQPTTVNSAESDLIFAGLQGMMDPPRQEVKEVMHRVHAEAGMRVLMITGDYIETAKAVAKEIGIEGQAITGQEIDQLSQEEFEDRVEKISVYARVNPEHKIRIVKALKKHGHQVAMTGDGVNDAPAIKAADIGIAMGINGTDAAKEASDLILLDDQFLTIINAIEEGRGIFDNVRKFVSYLLGANIAEVLVVMGGILILNDPILTATQLLFINIITDGLPAIALGSDPAEEKIMRYKPAHFQQQIINRPVWIEMFAYGVMITGLILGHFHYIESNNGAFAAISAGFTALVVYELVRLIVLRTNYNIPWFANPWLSVALFASFLTHILVLYFQPLADLFKVEPISSQSWLIIGVGSVLIFVMMKLVRVVINRYFPEVSSTSQVEQIA